MTAINQKFILPALLLSVLSISLAVFMLIKYQKTVSTLTTDVRTIQEREADEINIDTDVDNSGVAFISQTGDQISIVGQKGIMSGYNSEKKAFILQIDAPTCSTTQKLTWETNQFKCIDDTDTDTTDEDTVDNDPPYVDIDTDIYTTGLAFDEENGELSLSSNGLEGFTVNLDGRYLTSYIETDAVVGNEVTGATTNKGLILSGSGTTLSPHTLGIDYSGNCSGSTEKLLYNGATGVWTCGSDIDTDTTYTASNQGITLDGTVFGLTLEGSTLTKGTDGLKVNAVTTGEITNGTITNDDISSSAGLSWSKISKTSASITDLDVPTLTGNENKVLSVNATADGLVWVTDLDAGISNSLDYAELKDAMSLDATTTITFSTYDLVYNLTGTGDFKIQDNGVDVLYISDGGKIGINTTSPTGDMEIVGNMYISGDRQIECNGSISDEVGDCSAHSEGAAMIALSVADKICTNSSTIPTAIRIDTDTTCNNGSGNEGTYILGTSATTATVAITSQWAYFDSNSSNTYTDGEDIYFNSAPLLTYQSGNLYVNNIILSQPVWTDLRISGSTLGSGASAPDQVTWVSASNLKVKGFDGTSTMEQLFFEVQLGHDYKEGTDLHPHIHWGPTTTGAGNVKWILEYSWVNIMDTTPAVTTISSIQAAGGVAYKHLLTEFPEMLGTNKGLSSMIIGRIYRDPTDVQDTYAGDAGLLELDFHYQTDGLGSVSETSKE